MEDIEIWKPIARFEGFYEVSSKGRVRSLTRIVQRTSAPQTIRGRILKPFSHPSGHLQVKLRKKGESRYAWVHHLVMEHFGKPRPSGKDIQTRHLNGNPKDNRIENLEWGSRSENTYDMVKHGSHNNARKIKCKRGHRLSGANLHTRSTGGRVCLSCRKGRDMARRDGGDIQMLSDQVYMSIVGYAPEDV